MNEFEEHFNEKKKKFKYEIRIHDEHQQLEDIQDLDPANIDVEVMERAGISLPNASSDVLNKVREDKNKMILKQQLSLKQSLAAFASGGV